MPSLNKTIIIGNLGGDPELRYTPGGNAVAEFSVAVNKNRKDQHGEWQTETTWFRCTTWREQAERVAEQMRKGNLVYVEGRIHTRSYTHKDYPVTMYAWELIAERVVSLERRSNDRQDDAYVDEQVGPAEPRPENPPIDVDDIPF